MVTAPLKSAAASNRASWKRSSIRRRSRSLAAVRAPEPQTERSDTAAAYHAAAAARAARDRAHVTARLVRMGAVVVDAEPDTLAPRLADAYLDLKAAGRL